MSYDPRQMLDTFRTLDGAVEWTRVVFFLLVLEGCAIAVFLIGSSVLERFGSPV